MIITQSNQVGCNEKLLRVGHQRLAEIRPNVYHINTWKTRLIEYQPRREYADDGYVWLTCILALEAIIEGNFGVGSILVNEGDDIVVHNEVFSPYFRSDRHAEMVVMDAFEDARRAPGGLDRFTLYTSLEPCPMCLIRLSTSDIGRVLFAARDIPGGMVHRMNELPPFWIELAQRKIFQQAACSPALMDAANEIFRLNLDALTEKIKAA